MVVVLGDLEHKKQSEHGEPNLRKVDVMIDDKKETVKNFYESIQSLRKYGVLHGVTLANKAK